ncbi:sensor histidine kinase [Oceanobacillus polygoni]|uniref:histidine kinase n=1 Tax=Oceanobacillus polygoni TaxID=1235259 RepID=A0A9X0YRN3_9BACI|nr:sensor histidine kinase [Oceanobacillus polygoni]MBP2076747.1 signal transduction histidine kinase [Oceanobacillus polygoni]
MDIFWLRFALFSLIWVMMILQDSINTAFSVVLFAVALAIYFLMSLNKAVFSLFICLTLIIGIHSLFYVDDFILAFILFGYCLADAAVRLKRRQLIRYLLLTIVVSSISILKLDMFDGQIALVYLLFTLLLFLLNRMIVERKEQWEIYDQLLGEYRKLKRMNLAAEDHARLEERTKIARDIHDSVGHRLTALIMKLEMLSIQRKDKSFDELKQMAKESLEETRHAVKTLQSEENEGIATVVHLIRKLEAESHILVQFTMKQGVLSIPLSNEKSVVLYRVIQEALTNAMRHAQSREVKITLGKTATEDISFEIMNAVFEPKPFQFGFGLSSMKNRVEEVGGKLTVYQTEKHFIVSGMIPG